MSKVELVVFLIAVVSGGTAVGAAVAASRHYAARRRERQAKYDAHRRSSAIEQLERWRNQGLVVIEDQALEAAIYWEGADPKALKRLVHLIHTILAEEKLEPGDRLGLRLKETDEDKSIGKGQSPPRGLELIAGFS